MIRFTTCFTLLIITGCATVPYGKLATIDPNSVMLLEPQLEKMNVGESIPFGEWFISRGEYGYSFVSAEGPKFLAKEPYDALYNLCLLADTARQQLNQGYAQQQAIADSFNAGMQRYQSNKPKTYTVNGYSNTYGNSTNSHYIIQEK